MFKINNTLLELNKKDKINLLKKILALKEEEKIQRKKVYSDNIETIKDKEQEDIQEDIQEVKDKHNNLSIDYLTDKDKDLLQIFFNAIDINKFNLWDIMTKKYKIIYNILRNGNDLNTDIDNLSISYSYNDILFIQTLLNYNNYGLHSWEDSTSNLKKFIDIVYGVLKPTINVITESHTQVSSQEEQTNYNDDEDNDSEEYSKEEEDNIDEEYSTNEEDYADEEYSTDEEDYADEEDTDDEETDYNRNIYSDYDYDTDSDVDSDIQSDIEIYLISESD